MKSFKSLINRTLAWVNEPHEKFLANVILMIFFWMVYYSLYITDKNSMIINPDIIRDNNNNRLNFFDFAWFATITQFGITFGDIVPKSPTCKLAVMIHAFSFWYVALS